MSEHTGVHRISGDNEGTRISALLDLEPTLLPLGAREAFIAAYDRLRGLASITRRPAVLVAAVDGHARVVEAVVVESGHSLIIGRHSCCGLRLPAGTVALRQLVVHAWTESPGSQPAIRLWDLNTEQPFITEDGQPNAAVIAQGTLYAAVGQYALLFIPTLGPSEMHWPARAEEAWKGLPPRQFIDRRTPNAARLQNSRRVRADGQDYYTPITRTGPLLLLGEDEGAEDAWGELQMVRGIGAERHRFSLARLEQGVLLGRYDRCGVSLSEFASVSRVHLILVRMGEDILAIDTASTNGTWRGSTKIQTTPLDELDSLRLGDELRFLWRRLPSEDTGGSS